ncbi:small heat shock protein [Boletus coccyginus]|nr:small heat shock protein [Boletus coccyginus]
MSSLTRHNFYDPLAQFDGLFDDAFNAHFWPSVPSPVLAQRARAQRPDSFRPILDLHESKDTNTVTATFELPGLKSEDVTIDLHNDRLTVSGESATSNAHEEGAYAVRERHLRQVLQDVETSLWHKDVKAKMENGVLTLTFPKVTPEQQAKRINIQ